MSLQHNTCTKNKTGNVDLEADGYHRLLLSSLAFGDVVTSVSPIGKHRGRRCGIEREGEVVTPFPKVALSCVVTDHKRVTNRLGIRKTLRHGGQEEIQEYNGAPTRFVRCSLLLEAIKAGVVRLLDALWYVKNGSMKEGLASTREGKTATVGTTTREDC